MKRIVVIGGGISGLSTAYYIKEQSVAAGYPVECLLIEKGNVLGGNIVTERVNGFLIEGGPDCFLSEKPWAAQLCRHLGLGDEIIPTQEDNKGTSVFSNGRLHNMPEGLILMVPTKIMPLITTSLFSLRGKVRMALEIFVPRKRDKEDESLGSFVRRRLGREALEKIAEPLVAGIHAGNPETMSMRASFPKFIEMEELYGSLIKGMIARMKKTGMVQRPTSGPKPTMFMTLKGGLGTMIDAILSRLDSFSIKFGTTVSRIEVRDKRYLVFLDGGEVVDADSVILATPAYISSALLKDVDIPLSDKLLAIPYASTATVSLAFKSSEVNIPRSFGFVIPGMESRKIMAATFTSYKFEGRAPEGHVMIRCFIGGSKNENLVDLDDSKMVEMIKGELKDIVGIDAEPVLSKVYRWRKAMPQYTIGHLDRVRWLFDRLHKHPGIYLTGSAYHGVGISDSIREGEVTAKKALDFLFAEKP